MKVEKDNSGHQTLWFSFMFDRFIRIGIICIASSETEEASTVAAGGGGGGAAAVAAAAAQYGRRVVWQ